MYSILVHTCLWGSLVLYSLLVLPFYLLTLLLPRASRGHFMRIITLYLGRTGLYIGLRPFVKIEYQDEAEGTRQAGIYICNHRSGLDAILVAALNLELIQMVKGWPMRLPFVGFNARRCEYIDISRMALEEYVPYLRRLLDAGVSVVVFAEGTRSQSRELNTFHSGVFHLAMDLHAPVFPCCIAGNENFPDKHFHFSPCKRIIIRRLKAVQPETYQTYPSAFAFKKKTHSLMAEQLKSLDLLIDGE